MISGRNSTGQRFASIPCFTLHADGQIGKIRRQCSKEYKTQIIGKMIRREVLGLQPRQRIPRAVTVHQYFGISLDEAGRSIRIRQRLQDLPWAVPHFPLIERFMSRRDCQQWLEKQGIPHQVPRSACVCCPYRSDTEWLWLKENDPAGFDRACEIDEALRRPGIVANRGMDSPMFLHRSCIPLRQLVFKPERTLPLFTEECEGICGV